MSSHKAVRKKHSGKSGATSNSILYLIGRHVEISAIDHHASNTVECILLTYSEYYLSEKPKTFGENMI